MTTTTINSKVSFRSFGSTAKSIARATVLRPVDAAGIKWMATQYTTSRASGNVRVERTWSDQEIAKRYGVTSRMVNYVLHNECWREIEPMRPANLLAPKSDR